jgi:hypothetical protein
MPVDADGENADVFQVAEYPRGYIDLLLPTEER